MDKASKSSKGLPDKEWWGITPKKALQLYY